MSIEQAVMENLRGLPPEAQRQVLDFTQKLRHQTAGVTAPLSSLHGLWRDLDIKLTAEDIAEARRTMWGEFPREIEP